MSAGAHLFWITSRAAGTAALLVASVSVCVGIQIGRRRKGDIPLGDRLAIHEALSLTTLALIALHGLALLGDHFFHPGIVGIAVPFVGGYRPVWTGIGIVGGYGLAALGLSYYIRDRIGQARWRTLHRFTALFWALGVAHSIGAGTDALTVWFLFFAGVTCIPAGVLILGRLAQGIGAVLDLPRERSPVH